MHALKLSYDHIGKVMLTNFIWFCVGFGPMLAFSYLPFLQNDLFFYLSVILSFITMGCHCLCTHRMNRVVRGEETSFRDSVKAQPYWLRGTGSVLLAVLALLF